MYSTLAIVLLEIQRSMTDICKISGSLSSKGTVRLTSEPYAATSKSYLLCCWDNVKILLKPELFRSKIGRNMTVIGVAERNRLERKSDDTEPDSI